MGCKWSGDKGDFHAIHHGGVEIDPVSCVLTRRSCAARDAQAMLILAPHRWKSACTSRPGKTRACASELYRRDRRATRMTSWPFKRWLSPPCFLRVRAVFTGTRQRG